MTRAFVLAALLAFAAAPSAFAEVAVGARSAGDGWTVHVSVRPSDLGPLVVSVARVQRLRESGSSAWLRHELVFENRSDRGITFADTWTAVVLGRSGRPMLVASSDRRCGYLRVKPLRAVCILPLDIPFLKAQGRLSRTVTLWKGLPGTVPLAAGTYVFRVPLLFQVGREVPGEGAGRSVTVRLVYRVAVR